jgi:hypothetical protein
MRFSMVKPLPVLPRTVGGQVPRKSPSLLTLRASFAGGNGLTLFQIGNEEPGNIAVV